MDIRAHAYPQTCRPDDPPSGSSPRSAVFLDRDGTLTEPRRYPSHPEDLVLQPGIAATLRAFQRNGTALVVVTNQSALARGLFDYNTLATMHSRLRDLLEGIGVKLDAIYTCPHHPHGSVPALAITCACRKPRPGMLLRAAKELNIDLRKSWMIGDSLSDVQAGTSASTRTALVSACRESVQGVKPDIWASTTAKALTHAYRSRSSKNACT
ncbi:MAG: HAD family hydrolase [Pseudonocardiaceae bacterium]